MAQSFALFLAMLWFAALFAGVSWQAQERSVADRCRDATFVAIALIGALGLAHLLYFWVCFPAAFAIAAVSFSKRLRRGDRPEISTSPTIGYGIATTTALFAFWPQFVRPLLQGDSLFYHLPNATSWVHAHSLWATTTYYWFYPPGSELFAAAAFLIGGPGALPLAGLAPALLIGFRLVEWSRRYGFSSWESGLVASVFLSLPVASLQIGTLQNDLWLAAWCVELAWAASHRRDAIVRTCIVLSLLKPVGVVFAFVGCCVFAVPIVTALAFVPLAIWGARTFLLAKTAMIPLGSTATADPLATSVLAHGGDGIATLAHALIGQGPAGLAMAAIGVWSLFAGTPIRLRLFAACALVVFGVEPYGFENGRAQLATGESLRFALPALALSFVALLPALRALRRSWLVVASLLTCYDTISVFSIFRSDPTTYSTPAVALVFFVLVRAYRQQQSEHPARYAALVWIAVGALIQVSREPGRYYAAQFGGAGGFDWLAAHRPAAVVAVTVPSGAIAVVLPSAEVADASHTPCREARELGAIIVATIAAHEYVNTFEERDDAERLDDVERCGSLLYADTSMIVAKPAP